ncbi:hypothetical protein JAAARDRAFT_29565 [Jaapia argillacea MUCL 33604]|uniref:Vacuolar protein sorting-associated protein n=1 Tax=Jaapia argillacea MUCL 33604 TaxID=933084 RepID=A0A067QJ60_9AGAM|nr:hypothetical protein JAAARDRAFT_29565 [Jaapia argillacea MUCL 33604]
MWWLDPGKEVLNVVFNRILAPYIENLDLNQVNYGIGQGQLTLRKLRLTRGALDKFRLPVDVLEGHLGKFTLSLHWMNLGNQPVEILIEDVYLLVVPSPETKISPEEEEERTQAAKAERLENSELLHMRGETDMAQGDSQESQGLISSLITKIVNNVQVTVKNIHIRYEDKMSVPGHPFAAGITLAGFSAVSTNEDWQAAFIESTAGAIHKLAKLESLAVYFDTDSESMAGLPAAESIQKFNDLISKEDHVAEHQFILKPVTGEGRIVMNSKIDKDIPQFDVQLLFDEIGVILDDNQYRDAISLAEMFHFYARQHQYRKFRPTEEQLAANKAKARLDFATTAVLEGVRERHRKWTWTYFAERRDDRKKYVDLFRQKALNPLPPNDLKTFQALERKLSYEDLRFYRSIARSHLRKDLAARKKLEEERKKQQQEQAKSSWSSWIWGSSAPANDAPQTPTPFTGEMTDEQRKQLYDVLDYDEKTALAESFETPRDALKTRIVARLNKGSMALKADPHGKINEVISVVFDDFHANLLQRPDNFEAAISLGGFGVFDGTTQDTLYPQIVHVKDSEQGGVVKTNGDDDPFFFLKFERNPLDERADSALTVKMRHMEIIYHRGYVEAVYRFFKPPASQLESVEALLDVASQTLEGLRKETRAGLEYALQTHKTIDIQMDMNAPIIIIPEDITNAHCKHLVIDAGHIAIESDLADKDAIRQIQLKRLQQYTEEDQKKLESLMYDKFSLRLEAAQFLIGNDLQSCRKALTAVGHDNLHLLERVSLGLEVQNSIVPSVLTLARFKVSGTLPTLQVNLSDTKYKSLMRLIDVCIPHFDDETEADVPPPKVQTSGAFQLPSLFGTTDSEYGVDTEDEENGERKDHSTKADDGDAERLDLHQHIFEFNFQVEKLRVSLSKSSPDGNESPVGDLGLEGFSLAFALAKFDMKVDVNLKSLTMDVDQPGQERMQCISSAISDVKHDKDLLTVAYTRVQQISPEYASIYEGIDQNVDIRVSTLIFHAAPEPVVFLYDFIMGTFVPQSDQVVTSQPLVDQRPEQSLTAGSESTEKIRVLVKLAGVQVVLINETISLATLSLSTADVSIILRGGTMGITGRLASLSLSDDSTVTTALPEFKQIMSIEGDNLAEFRYQTFDPSDANAYTGIKSSVYFNAASIKFNFLEQPLHDIYLFVTKLAKLKGIYDAATQAAIQSASEIERMQFKVTVKSPIVVFPSDPAHSQDVLALRLGEIGAENSYDGDANTISAGLQGIQLVSKLMHAGQSAVLKIIDDINITAQVIQTNGIDRSTDSDYPDLRVSIKISDIKLHLTQVQYVILLALSQSIPRVLAGAPEGSAQADQSMALLGSSGGSPRDADHQSLVDLQPELRPVTAADGSRPWTTVDLMVGVSAVKLHLYDAAVSTESTLKEHGIARFALNENTLRLKLLSDGAGEAQIVLKSFTMSNTRPGASKFREIIPAAQHDRNQVMILYTMSSTKDQTTVAVVTVDSPQIIFTVDPLFALLDFFTSGFPSPPPSPVNNVEIESSATTGPHTPSSSLDFRVDLHDLSIRVLEDDARSDTQAIQLSIKQVSLSQQGILALTVSRLGMSLMRMGDTSESVRFLDEVDLTFSLDSRTSALQQMTNIEVTAKPIVFRASYRDINLIMTIVNKALELYANSTKSTAATESQPSRKTATPTRAVQSVNKEFRGIFGRSLPRSGTLGQAQVVVSKEQFKGSFDGFRLVLIGDLYEQPMLHLKVKPFILGAKDWSGRLQATSTLAVQISYWNLANSHWEPLIDPWAFTLSVAKEDVFSGPAIRIFARERLDLNVSTTFVELLMTTIRIWGKEGDRVLQKARGSSAPYRIRNRTGSSIYVWSDLEGGTANDGTGIKVAPDQTIEWRFDDWKTMREHVSSTGNHTIGVKLIGKPWEQLRSLPVDREGEYTFPLRPKTDKFPSRLLCEVKLQENVKVVTLRSTYKVENHTMYPLEVTLVDEVGHPAYSLEKIAPGEEYSLPIEAVGHNRIRLQPDQGFGYRWSPAIRWEDLIAKKNPTIRCPHGDEREAAFRFQAWVDTDITEAVARRFPKINLKLRAPLELENLLPYNLQYRIYDKNTDQNWRSYLRSGGLMPVHSIELSHLVLLNVQVEDTVFKPSEFAIINTDGNADLDIDKNLTMRDPRDAKLDVKLNYVRYPDSGGAFKVQIYSPYIVINKTGLPFNVKSFRSGRVGSPQDAAGETRPDILSRSTPFMLSHPQEKKHEFTLRVGESAWSRAISMDAPSADTCLVIPSQNQRSEEAHIGLSWAEGSGKYKLTKVIALNPRFLVKNNLSDPICFREHGVAPKARSILKPGERIALTYLRVGPEKLLTIAFPGLNANWSAPINIEDIGSIHLRLQHPGENNNVQLVRADVQLDGSTIFITFSPADDGWPFVIENVSEYPVSLMQTDIRNSESEPGVKARATYALKPRSSMNYAWDYPSARDKKIQLKINDARRTVDIMEIGDLVPFKFAVRQGSRAVSLDVRADGPKQVLRIANYNPEVSLYKPRHRQSLSIARSDTATSSQEAFEAVVEDIPSTLSLNVELEGVGLSLINQKLVEVVYLSANGLKLEYSTSAAAQTANITCGGLQIDNQLHDAIFPVVLQPTPISKEVSGVAALPTIQASLIWLNDEEHGVIFIKYCSILLQALTIEADEDFLFALYDLSQVKGLMWEEGQDDILVPSSTEIAEPKNIAHGPDLYFEVLELQPIRLSISFMRTERVSGDAKLSTKNPLAVIVNALTMTLGNINDAPLELNALAIKDMRLSLPDLENRIMLHYRQDILRQLYRILGSADFIGNPVGLFTNVSSGVADIFYEPWNGVVMHGNKELGIGIAKGAASFVKKTVFGLSDSVTKFTSSIGKGLSAATFDSEYQTRRRMNQRRNRPRHAIYGVTAGAEAFANSVASGVEGVLMKPIEGAETGGAAGFFKGVGKGLVGVVTKPMIGVFDLASNVSEGIRNTTTVFDNPERDRVRLPRYISPDGVLSPFASREALGQYWMKDLEQGIFRKESYVAHINLPGGDNVVLLTASRVLCFSSRKLRLEWELPFTHAQGVTIEDTGIRFAHKAGKDHDKFVFIPDKASQSWFFGQVASVVKNFNIRRRMDS